MNIKIGDTLVIHCYKHNGVIHKSWKSAVVLEVNDDFIVLGNENVLVTKQDGRTWHRPPVNLRPYHIHHTAARIRDERR